jgi:hypothetical protein
VKPLNINELELNHANENTEDGVKKTIQKIFTKETCLVDHNGGPCTCSYSYDEKQKPLSPKDFKKAIRIMKKQPLQPDYLPANLSQKEPEEWEKEFIKKFVVVVKHNPYHPTNWVIRKEFNNLISPFNVMDFISSLLSQQRTQTIEEERKNVRELRKEICLQIVNELTAMIKHPGNSDKGTLLAIKWGIMRNNNIEPEEIIDSLK